MKLLTAGGKAVGGSEVGPAFVSGSPRSMSFADAKLRQSPFQHCFISFLFMTQKTVT